MEISKCRSNAEDAPFLKNSDINDPPSCERMVTLPNRYIPSSNSIWCEAKSPQHREDQNDEGELAYFTKKLRDVGIVQLLFLCFFLTAGGPFGLEVCVASCGVGPTLIGILAAPVFFVLPQIAMTAELSTMMPENGSYIVWVSRGCGPFWGCINGYNSLLCNIFDNAIYPVLTMEYWLRLYPSSLTDWEVLTIKMGIVLAGASINLFRVRIIGNISLILTLVVISPFAAEFIQTISKIIPSKQWMWSPPTGGDRQWSEFFSTLLWLHTGWDEVGSVAGEVKIGQNSYITAFFLCAFMNCFVYLIAIISAATVSTEGIPSNTIWSDAYFLTVAQHIFPMYGGIWVALVSAIDNISMYLVGISTSSRDIMKMADDGRHDDFEQNKVAMIPGFMGYEWRRTSSPVVAVVAQSMVTMILIQFKFTFLVDVDVFANSISLLLELVSFIRLRYTEPKAKRPFKVPGGMFVAWTITIMKFSFVFTTIVIMAYQEWKPLLCILIFNIVIALTYFVKVNGFPSR